MPTLVKAVLFDADGVTQYAPEKWADGFARGLAFERPDQVKQFTVDVCEAEIAHLSRVDGFDEALDDVLRAWDRLDQKSFVIETMLSIEPHHHVMDTIKSIRASGIQCYIASNQQTQRAKFMAAKFGYSAKFDGQLYSCMLGAAKPSERFYELALKAVGATASQTLFIDDRPENVDGASRVGLHAVVYDGQSGATELRSKLRKFGIEFDS